MAVYVEGFRNVPLLLWIVLIFAIMTEATPQPRDFREGGAGVDDPRRHGRDHQPRRLHPRPGLGRGALLLGIVFLLR